MPVRVQAVIKAKGDVTSYSFSVNDQKSVCQYLVHYNYIEN